jgi:hypothetical protein
VSAVLLLIGLWTVAWFVVFKPVTLALRAVAEVDARTCFLSVRPSCTHAPAPQPTLDDQDTLKLVRSDLEGTGVCGECLRSEIQADDEMLEDKLRSSDLCRLSAVITVDIAMLCWALIGLGLRRSFRTCNSPHEFHLFVTLELVLLATSLLIAILACCCKLERCFVSVRHHHSHNPFRFRRESFRGMVSEASSSVVAQQSAGSPLPPQHHRAALV